MATASQCRTDILPCILQLGLMYKKKKKAHTNNPGALMQRDRGDKVMKVEISLSLNYFIPFTVREKKTDLLPVEQMHTVIRGERTRCFLY